jgi:hypothetical protein
MFIPILTPNAFSTPHFLFIQLFRKNVSPVAIRAKLFVTQTNFPAILADPIHGGRGDVAH